MEHLLTNDILNLLRRIGDPRVDHHVADALPKGAPRKDPGPLEKAREKGLVGFLEDDWLAIHAKSYGLGGFLSSRGTPPDPDLVKTACDLFARYGSEIAAALPEAYAAGGGANVLFERSQLTKEGTPSTNRIKSTAQFVIWIMTPGTLHPPVSDNMHTYTYQNFDATTLLWGAPNGQALCASLALRIMHSVIRNTAPARAGAAPTQPDGGNMPLNQEDLLATLLSFSITVFEVLEKFGISWSEEEQYAYFYVWDHVGQTMGIGDFPVISTLTRCDSFEDLRLKLRQYEEKHPADDWEKSAKGTVADNSGGRERRAAKPVAAGGIPAEDVDDLLQRPRNRQVLRRIADNGTLRPTSVPEARLLLGRLRERMWTLENDRPPKIEPFAYENFRQVLEDVSAGRILLRALVDTVVAQLQPNQQTWPIEVIRQLVPPRVQNRLALGGTGPVGLLSGLVNTPRDVPGSLVLRRMAAEILRQRATRVANSLFLDYWDRGLLEIPGLRSPALG